MPYHPNALSTTLQLRYNCNSYTQPSSYAITSSRNFFLPFFIKPTISYSCSLCVKMLFDCYELIQPPKEGKMTICVFIDSIESNVETASHNVEAGNVQLASAAKYQVCILQ